MNFAKYLVAVFAGEFIICYSYIYFWRGVNETIFIGISQRVFFLEAIKDIKTIGSITGSSKQLIEKMIKPIPFENKLQIVEFGAGDGCITRAIQSKLSIGSHLKSFELNESLYQRLAGSKY